MDEFFQYLSALYPLCDELKAALVCTTLRGQYRRHRPLLSQGDVGDWIAFLEKGLVKLCYDGPGDQERIICFLRAGEVACSMTSFHGAAPSRLAIVALEETVVRKLPKKEAEAIADRYPAFHRHLRRITEAHAMQLEAHNLLLAEPARERLAKLPEHCDWLLKDRRIKQYMIAAYLGVDPATLSRWKGDR